MLPREAQGPTYEMTPSMLGVVDGFGGKLLKLELDETTRR
jgi:hypothetical protein